MRSRTRCSMSSSPRSTATAPTAVRPRARHFCLLGRSSVRRLRVTKGADSLMVIGDPDASHAVHCGECGSLLYWTLPDGAYVRVAYGTLVDEPALKPTAHIFVGSKAAWHEILDDLPQHDEY